MKKSRCYYIPSLPPRHSGIRGWLLYKVPPLEACLAGCYLRNKNIYLISWLGWAGIQCFSHTRCLRKHFGCLRFRIKSKGSKTVVFCQSIKQTLSIFENGGRKNRALSLTLDQRPNYVDCEGIQERWWAYRAILLWVQVHWKNWEWIKKSWLSDCNE